MGKSRISKKDSTFNQYLGNTTTALLLIDLPPAIGAWQRLLLTLPEKDQWVAYRDQWNIVYPKYTDLAQRTVSIKNEKNTLKNNFITFAEDLLTRMVGSKALTAAERVTFNLKVPDRTPTSRPAIDASPSVLVRAKEGRRIQVECRVIADSNRPSKHTDCDVVEYRYTVAAVSTGAGTPPMPPAPPSTPSPGMPVQQVIGETGKAKFILQLANEDAGKQFTMEARWKNSKENQKSGPWSAAVQVMVVW